jgi:large subunit ribosomal protein L18
MSRAKANTRLSFRRRREKKTNYKKRLALLKSNKPRLVVRKTNRQIIVQIITFHEKGDLTHVHVSKKQLAKYGWEMKRNSPSAYLAGYLAGKIAINKGFKEAILDIGLHTPTKGCLAFIAAKGAIDAGLKIPFSAEVEDDRAKGKHINLHEKFEQVMKKIEGEYGK